MLPITATPPADLTIADLLGASSADLSAVAKKIGLSGYSSLKKDQKIIQIYGELQGELPGAAKEVIQMSSSELNQKAREEDIEGRGSMRKDDLILVFLDDILGSLDPTKGSGAVFDQDPVDYDTVYVAIFDPDAPEDGPLFYCPRETYPGVATYGIPLTKEGLEGKANEANPWMRRTYWDKIVEMPPPDAAVKLPSAPYPMDPVEMGELVKAHLSQDE